MTCYKASGVIYMRRNDLPDQPFRNIGNGQVSLTTAIEETSVPNYASPAGGNACVDKQISKVGVDLTLYDFDGHNLALATQGYEAVGSVAPVVDEVVNAFIGHTALVKNLINLAVAPVVSSSDGATTYAAPADYTVVQGGIRVTPGGAIAAAIALSPATPKFVPLRVDYTPTARTVVEALTRAGSLYEIVLLTQNRVDAGKYGRWNIFSTAFGPSATLAPITREFGNLVLAGEALPDSTQGDGTDESQYFQIQSAT